MNQLARLATFIFLLAAPNITRWKQPNFHILWGSHSLDGWQSVQVIALLAAALMAAVAARIKSQGPLVNSDGVLEDDYRGARAIRFRNKGPVAARGLSFVLTRILRNGEPVHETALPLELTTIDILHPKLPCYIKCFRPWRGANDERGFSVGTDHIVAVKQDGPHHVQFRIVGYCDSREVTSQWYTAIPVADDRIFDLEISKEPYPSDP